jgi:hypothetical protein
VNPRNDFSLFGPSDDWYENYWLRPEPVKQSTGFGGPRGVMTMVHRAMQFALKWPSGLQRRDEVSPGSNQMLTSSVFRGARGHGRGDN